MDPAAFDYVAAGRGTRSPRRQRGGLAPPPLRRASSSTSPGSIVDDLHRPASSLPVASRRWPSSPSPTRRRIEAARGPRRQVPFTLSTTSSHSIEAVAAGAPDAARWFQLYPQADPAISRSLVERAAAAGFRAIVLTVDLPVLGYRDRDRRSVWSAARQLRGGSPSRGGRSLAAPSRLQDRPVHGTLVGRPRHDPVAGRRCHSSSRAS